MDRRDFFKTSLAGAGALALASSPLGLVSSCAPKKKGAGTKLHLSFQHGTPPGETLAEKFDYMEKLGIEGQIPGKVSPQKKHERSQQILSLSDEKLRTHYNIYKGQTRPVLLEHSKKAGILHGFTDNYIRVEVKADKQKQLDNTIVQVRLGGWNEKGDALVGTIE